MEEILNKPAMFTIKTDADLWLKRFNMYCSMFAEFNDWQKINLLCSFMDDETFRLFLVCIPPRSVENAWEIVRRSC